MADQPLRDLVPEAAVYRIVPDPSYEAIALCIPWGPDAGAQYVLWIVRGATPHEVEVTARLQRIGDPILAGERVTVLPQ